MKKNTKQKLVDDLRKVAQMYFDRDKRLNKDAGLCMAVSNISKGMRSPFHEIYELGLIGHSTRSYFLCPSGKRWKARAMFALVLAEYLEGEDK